MMSPEELHIVMRSFQTSRVILTAAELDVFTKLDQNPLSAEALSRSLGTNPRATTRVLDVLVTFGLLAKHDNTYATTELAAPLSSHHPESIRPIVLHMNFSWENWSQLTETVRLGHNPNNKSAAESKGDDLRNFIGGMHVVGRQLSKEIASAYDAGRFRCMLDIGGGSGTYTLAFLEQYPDLHAVVFDLPNVIDMARERLDKEGLLERVKLVGGDFYEDELPTGCDMTFLSAIIHQNSPDQNVDLCRKIHRALEPGGALVIRDHIMDENRTYPPQGALFALNMLVATEGGDTFTLAEVEETLAKAGFTDVRLVRRGETMDCLVEAYKKTG
jgi:ubiquinone/menaquinone biosynthesis C-methylase UbiE